MTLLFECPPVWTGDGRYTNATDKTLRHTPKWNRTGMYCGTAMDEVVRSNGSNRGSGPLSAIQVGSGRWSMNYGTHGGSPPQTLKRTYGE